MHTLFAALAVVGTLGLVDDVAADPISLQVALDRAARRVSVESSRLGVDEARARTRGAALPLYNPELSIGAGPRWALGDVGLQAQAGLSQSIERGGKRDARVRLAEAEARGAEIDNRREILRARIEAWRAFERTLVLRDRLAVRTQVEALARSMVTAMQKSAAAGGVTKLRVNLVVADAGRATQERIAAENELASARAELAAAIGAAAREMPEPEGSVAELPAARSADELVARALQQHPVILEMETHAVEATARITDADARGAVDITVGVSYAYEAVPDRANAVLGSLTIPLGVRNRNQGERDAARIGAKRVELERTYARVEVERSVRLAAENFERARTAVGAFDREVSEKLNENLTAAQDAFTKGGLDFIELVTTQRELVASRVSYLDARLALIDAWAELARTAGVEVTL